LENWVLPLAESCVCAQAAKEAAEGESATWRAKTKQLRATAKAKLNEQKKEIEQLQVGFRV